MTLTDCSISGNYAAGGGGVANNGTATLTDCSISGNYANGGGGLSNIGDVPTLTLTACTISGNLAQYGGGLYNGIGYGNAPMLTLTNCTVSGNSATDGGGGLYQPAYPNYASGVATLTDTIVAGNTGPYSASDISGTAASQVTGSYNLIGVGGSGGITGGSGGNVVLTSLTGLGLAPLGIYGGPTETMALLPGSVAIGAGTAVSGVTTDQRGAPRPTAGATDIGAFQDQGYNLAVSSGSPQSTPVGQAFSAPLVTVLTENFANAPLPGVTIDFSDPSSGASATFSASFAVTDATGLATVTATANATDGTYAVTASASGVTSSASFNLTNQIGPSFLGLTDQTVTYGSAVTITGTLAAGSQVPVGEVVDVTVDGVIQDATIAADGSFSTADVVLNASSTAYDVTYTYATDGVFLAADGSSTLTVKPAELTITAGSEAKVYGQANPALTFSYSGFVNGDTSANLTTAATVTTTATTASPVGSGYAITASGAVDPNYAINYVPGTLTINAAALTITANDESKEYGQANPALTVSYSGFVNGDSSANLTTAATVTTMATTASPVGSGYAITASGAVDPNYAISYVPGTLTINTAALTVTANNQSKVYGQANPALTVSYSGFVNGDSSADLTTAPTVTTTATTASPVDSYATTASDAVDPNYTITYDNGALAVTPASLTITADSTSKTYGNAVTLAGTSFTASGLVTANGDAVTSVNLTSGGAAATAAAAGSPYSIAPSSAVGTGLGNYMITYINGQLTVNKAPLTITANSQSIVAGQGLPSLTVSYTGFVNGDTSASLTTAPTLSAMGSPASPAGNYTINVGGAGSPNYTITYVPGTLTVILRRRLSKMCRSRRSSPASTRRWRGSSCNSVRLSTRRWCRVSAHTPWPPSPKTRSKRARRCRYPRRSITPRRSR